MTIDKELGITSRPTTGDRAMNLLNHPAGRYAMCHASKGHKIQPMNVLDKPRATAMHTMARRLYQTAAILMIAVTLWSVNARAAAPVQVTSADPAAAPQGTVGLEVTITGSGFDNSAAVDFLVTGTTNPGGITVKKVTVQGSKKLIATIDIADTAVIAEFDVEVAVSNGRKGKGTSLFSVQKKGGGPDPVPDPCIGADQRGFPAFGFSRQIHEVQVGEFAWGIFLTDSTAQCERLIGSSYGGGLGRTISVRYEPQTAEGAVLTSGSNWVFVAASFAVSFDGDGVPTVDVSAFNTILRMSDLPPQSDWVPAAMGDPRISPDGKQFLFHATDFQEDIVFRCTFDPAGVDPQSCSPAHRGLQIQGASWAPSAESIYIAKMATSGSGQSLFRVPLGAGAPEELWSRGTAFFAPIATMIGGVEYVAAYEGNETTGCSSILVIRPSECIAGDCPIVNGSGLGHPARSLTWLPDGRIAGDGQSEPNRKNKCSPTGTITSFDVLDQTGTTTPLAQGLQPEGTGGG
jgi:hypothetical protein